MHEPSERIESLEETVKKKNQAKYNVKLEGEIKEWMEQVLGKKLDNSLSFNENIKSGVVLCEYVPLITFILFENTEESHVDHKTITSICNSFHFAHNTFIMQFKHLQHYHIKTS